MTAPSRPTLPAAIEPEPSADRIERFQSLEAGTYWRAARPVTHQQTSWPNRETEIPEGEVLLLLDIEHFDGKPHTVVLLEHPRDGGREQYRFLVDEFLANWQFAPDGEQVRMQEVGEVQAEVLRLQQELVEAQSNPALVAPEVEKGLKEWEKARAREAKSAGEKPAPAVTPPSLVESGRLRADVGHAIQARVSEGDLASFRASAEREMKIAEIKAGWIERRTNAIAESLGAMAPYFQEKSAVALAKTSQARRFAKEIGEGIASLDLYLGKGVEVVDVVADGAQASAGEPLTLMQRKLFMDEELAAFAPVSERFDFGDIEQFDRLLAESPELRAQIFPFERCVVSMAVRRSALDYRDAWDNLQRNLENRRVFLMVRNGERIHRVYSSEPSHEMSPRLFPAEADWEGVFRGIDGERVTFRDVAFTRKAEDFENLALHYKRFLILMAGLDHRLKLFGDFHGEGESLAFISKAFQERHFQFVADDEPGRLLANGMPPVSEWVARKNEHLASGSRVLCDHEALINPESAPSCEKVRYGRGSGGSFVETYAEPREKSGIHIAYREGEACFVDVPVTRSASWRRHTRPEFMAKVSLDKAKKSRDIAMPFLVLDAVKSHEILHYVRNRESRIAHVGYMRLFKAVAEELAAEELREAPTRAYLREAVLKGGVASESVVDELVDSAVRAWRAAQRGAALPGPEDRKAVETLLNYIHSAHHRQDDFVKLAEAHAQRSGLVPLRLALTGKNRLALYAEVPESERDERLGAWRWVKRLSLGVRARSLEESSSRLVVLTDKPDASEKVIKTWPGQSAWIRPESSPLKPATLATGAEVIESSVQWAGETFGPEGIEMREFGRLFGRWRKLLFAPGKLVPRTQFLLPIGGYVGKVDGVEQLVTIALQAPAHQVLHHLGDEKQARQVSDDWILVFADKESARQRLAEPLVFHLVATTEDLRDPIVSENARMFTPSVVYRADGYEPARGYSMLSMGPALEKDLETWIRAIETGRGGKPGQRLYMNKAVWDGKAASLMKTIFEPMGVMAAASRMAMAMDAGETQQEGSTRPRP